MSEQTSIANGPGEATPVGDIDREIAAANLAKLKLEIQDLQPKTEWSQRISRLIPIITATISIAGFLWGVQTFSQQQERDRQTREADQISRDKALYRSSYEQLLQFSSNQNMTVTQMFFLQKELNRLIDSIYPPNKQPLENQEEKRKLANSFFDLIQKDCDFTQARQVQFDMAALRESIGYQEASKESQSSLVIRKYLQALTDLEDKNSKLHARNSNSSKRIRKLGSDEFQESNALLGEPYRSLIAGFSCHLSRLTPPEQATAINTFANITGDKILTAQLFGSETPPRCP